MNILILAAGQNAVTEEGYPLCLTEFDSKPLIQSQIEQCMNLLPSTLIVALKDGDVKQYHLDDIVSLIAPNAQILKIEGETQGAGCTTLLASEWIDNDDELLIINGNELLSIDYMVVLSEFRRKNYDAGVAVFESIHPRYSYVKLDSDGYVIEASEKKPISKNATAGFYWYRSGVELIEACKSMIRKGASVNGVYYICPAFNELVLMQKKIGISRMEGESYHPLKNEKQVSLYESNLDKGRS